jgi:hypothetical protein
MKFYQLQTYQHLDKFCMKDSRNFLDLLLLQKLIGLSEVKNILEIGYYEGLTFGVLYESSVADTKLTSCDITYNHDIFRKFYNTKKCCTFHQCKSSELTLDQQYDFILIDGDHTYETVIEELSMLDTWATSDCIIMIDDHNLPGVKQALAEFILVANFSPVLIGPQQVFLVRKGNDSFYNLINQLKTELQCVSTWSTVLWNNWSIYQYQYTHEVFITALQKIIKHLDL